MIDRSGSMMVDGVPRVHLSHLEGEALIRVEGQHLAVALPREFLLALLVGALNGLSAHEGPRVHDRDLIVQLRAEVEDNELHARDGGVRVRQENVRLV